jgi:hypothetical protein
MDLLRALELDLAVEHAGHRITVTGAGGRFVARFSSLSSLWHFARLYLRDRRRMPRGISVRLEWRGFGWGITR